MSLVSAGILMYRVNREILELFLAHPGGPFFKNKDINAWTIPKGLIEEGEDSEVAAIREFEEETGIKITNKLISLGSVVQKGGKKVYCWAAEGNLPDNFILTSIYFEMFWPPGSKQLKKFPEIDKAEFFPVEIAREKILPAQEEFIDRLILFLNQQK